MGGSIRSTAMLVLALVSLGFAARHLFVLAGQSNMAGEPVWQGQGFPDSIPEVRFFNGYGGFSGSWRALRPGMASDSDRFGPEMTLATTLLAAFPSDTFAMIKVGYGGTALANMWLPPSRGGPGDRYRSFLQLVALARGVPLAHDTTVVDTLPVDTTSTDTTSIDTLGVDTTAKDTVAIDTTGIDTLAADTSSQDSTAMDSTIVDTTTWIDTTWRDSLPSDSLPVDTTALDSTGRDSSRVDTAAPPFDVDGYPLDGFFWMQGESDAMVDSSAQLYRDNFRAFVLDVRAAWKDSTMPWVIGLIDQQPVWVYSDAVREAQRSVCAELENMGYIETVGLPSDGIHFTAAGQKELGKRMAQKWMEMKGLRPPSTPVGEAGRVAELQPDSRVRVVDARGRFGVWQQYRTWREHSRTSNAMVGLVVLEVADPGSKHRFVKLPPVLR